MTKQYYHQCNSVICLVGIVSFAMYIVRLKTAMKRKKNRGIGSITVRPRGRLQAQEMRLLNLWVKADENGSDITADSAELTNSTSVVMSTVKGNKKRNRLCILGSLSSDVKAVGLDGVFLQPLLFKDLTVISCKDLLNRIY